jgi:hypothetical protein
MTIGNLYMSGNRQGVVISWHWPWSITWRWLLTAYPHEDVKLGFYRLSMYGGDGFACGLNTRITDICLRVQPNMNKE